MHEISSALPSLVPLQYAPVATPDTGIERLKNMDWAMETSVHGERVAEMVDRTPHFVFSGTGKLSERAIQPATAAARELLSGTHGPRVERALRGLLATFDAQSGVAHLQAMSFPRDAKEWLVGAVIGELSDPGSRYAPPANPSATERAEFRDGLEAGAIHATRFPNISYPAILFSPRVARPFLDAILGTNSAPITPDQPLNLDQATRVLIHELAHRLNYGPLDRHDDGTPEERSRLAMLSEGSAELISALPGIRQDAQRRMGLPVQEPEPYVHQDYAAYAQGVTAILRTAGLEPDDPGQREQVIELLGARDVMQVPAEAARRAVEQHGIDPARTDEVTRALEHIGEFGDLPKEEQTAEIARRIDKAHTTIEALTERDHGARTPPTSSKPNSQATTTPHDDD